MKDLFEASRYTNQMINSYQNQYIDLTMGSIRRRERYMHSIEMDTIGLTRLYSEMTDGMSTSLNGNHLRPK